jgi:hypothetical protein
MSHENAWALALVRNDEMHRCSTSHLVSIVCDLKPFEELVYIGTIELALNDQLRNTNTKDRLSDWPGPPSATNHGMAI